MKWKILAFTHNYFYSLFATLGVMTCGSHAAAQPVMVSPEIDNHPGEPFSYFSKPTDTIGVMDAQSATEITPEGYLYTGFGELMFFAGAHLTPVQQRIRTLEEGYLPIMHYIWRDHGIAYQFTLFTASLNGKPDGTLVNFIRVTMRNENKGAARADFATGVRYTSESNNEQGVGDNRFKRPHKAAKPGDYRQLGEVFNPDWEYRFQGNAFLRDGKVLYLFPGHPQEQSFTKEQSENDVPDLTPRKLPVLATTPVGIVHYSRKLYSGEEATLEFKMPVIPAAPGEELAAIEKADFDTYRKRVSMDWKAISSAGMQIDLPEQKVVDTFKANLIYDLISRDMIDGNYIQTVNKHHYHRFFLRDAADIVRMYDITGYPGYARQVLDFFPRWQLPDGNFLSQRQEYDAWGEVLWAYGQHYRMTKDEEFAKRVFPSIKRAVQWLQQARQSDPLHVMIASDVKDNEDIPGHITGYNFLALAGLKNAIIMADALGEKNDADAFRNEYRDYNAAFMKVLTPLTDKTGGYIPPALDGKMEGQDWGNLLGTYPENILDPWDPRITATLKATQARYQEGIITYGNGRWLHHYLTIKNILTELIRGEQEQAIHEFYGVLMHTSSTHAGFEYNIRPWGNRDFQRNLAPHGWFAAEYRTMLRNMLVREAGTDLHLLSAVSPEWIGSHKNIKVTRAPTEFGQISYELQQPDAGSAILRITSNWHTRPSTIIMHLPWFMQTAAVTADGKQVSIKNGVVQLPAETKEVRIKWQRKSGVPALSYEKAVADYKAEYRDRYAAYLSG